MRKLKTKKYAATRKKDWKILKKAMILKKASQKYDNIKNIINWKIENYALKSENIV